MCLRILSKKTYNILKFVNISIYFLKFKLKDYLLIFVFNNGLKASFKGLLKLGAYNFQTINPPSLSLKAFNLKPFYSLRLKAC